jgi:hypothetical protein
MLKPSSKEAIVIEIICACLCMVLGGIFLDNAFRTFFEQKGSLLSDCRDFSLIETIAGITFLIVGAFLMWESQQARSKSH